MRTLAVFLLAFLAAGQAAAQCVGTNLIEQLSDADRAELTQAIAEHPYPAGNFWQATRGGQTVHVVGTVHIPDPRLDPIVQTVTPALLQSEMLILEATASDQAALQRVMLERPDIAFLTEGPTLIDLLGDELWAKVADELNARGVPPFMAAKFRPWLLGMTLAIPQCAMTAMTSGETGLDSRLEGIARDAGIAIEALDDPEGLLTLLSQGTLDEQIDMLRLTLAFEGDQGDAMATTLDSYFAGRHRELWEFSKITARDMEIGAVAFETFEKDLLDNRNAAWEPKIEAFVRNRDAMIAVGAAHLSGETGVLRALERMGFALTRL